MHTLRHTRQSTTETAHGSCAPVTSLPPHSINTTHSLSTHERTHTPNRPSYPTNALGPSAQRAPHLNQTTHAAPPRAQRAAQPCRQGGGWLRSGVGASHRGGGQPRSEAGARGAGRRQEARPAQPARRRGPSPLFLKLFFTADPLGRDTIASALTRHLRLRFGCAPETREAETCHGR